MKLTAILTALLISLTGFSQTNTAMAFKTPIQNDFTGSTSGSSLVDFGAIHTESKINLKWVTASEKNVSHFQLERSLDGVNYSAACVVFAYGNTTENKVYTFSDKVNNSQTDIIYYRLRSINNDGKTQLSDIIRISKDVELIYAGQLAKVN